ncbi:Htur_1727 family rSAM-partnered candidate RiPP [Natronococcus occultus]|uniref:RSAM-partnered protein, Htur_1727 family n=1 Tax=Natronococcus occultus SP4 TaxID=694430 RepID=L0JY76_9EURY|nr:Htur_1727 family rSAM-partnered candidate RiPP [Natronococcus occultus]AGB37255.1 rSAM-partnered protein, Htur_1727 family [Natronococcus occultus SP4]
MVEKPIRSKVENERASASTTPRWEVFVRDAETESLSYVGTVVAPDEDAAHERASRLFGWYAVDIWLCPAADVVRYSAQDGTDGVNAADGTASEDTREPRVYEETEGTPGVGEPSNRT